MAIPGPNQGNQPETSNRWQHSCSPQNFTGEGGLMLYAIHSAIMFAFEWTCHTQVSTSRSAARYPLPTHADLIKTATLNAFPFTRSLFQLVFASAALWLSLVRLHELVRCNLDHASTWQHAVRIVACSHFLCRAFHFGARPLFPRETVSFCVYQVGVRPEMSLFRLERSLCCL